MSGVAENVSSFASAVVLRLKSVATVETAFRLARFAVIFVVIRVIYKILVRATQKIDDGKIPWRFDKKMSAKILRYAYLAALAVLGLALFGVNVRTIFGAAGILGIAFSLAAQSSLSNVVSGFFVISDHSFNIGDTVQIGDVLGTVETISLISMKIRTFNNQIVRIPNETVAKSNLFNFSLCEHRRHQFSVGVAYDSDLEKLRETLLAIPARCPHAVQDPVPSVVFDGFAESEITILLNVWSKTADYMAMRSEVFAEIHSLYRSGAIKMVYPQLDVHFDGVPR